MYYPEKKNAYFHKVTYLLNGTRRVSGGHTALSAQQTVLRLQARGAKNVTISATSESIPAFEAPEGPEGRVENGVQ